MELYTGIDIIEIARIEKAIKRWGQRFLHRIYTDNEIERYGNKSASLAARFAAKEAVMKLLGTGKIGVSWDEIEILSNQQRKPQVILYGKAQNEATRLGIKEIVISLSHSREYAIASVIGSGKT